MLYNLDPPRRPAELSMGAWYSPGNILKTVGKAAIAPIVAPIIGSAYLIKAAAPGVRDLVQDTGAAVRDAAGALRPPPPPPSAPTVDTFLPGGLGGTGAIGGGTGSSSATSGLTSALPIIIGGVVAAGLVLFAVLKKGPAKKGKRGAS